MASCFTLNTLIIKGGVMAYAYGMKGSPAVGNGLGGLPRRGEKSRQGEISNYQKNYFQPLGNHPLSSNSSNFMAAICANESTIIFISVSETQVQVRQSASNIDSDGKITSLYFDEILTNTLSANIGSTSGDFNVLKVSDSQILIITKGGLVAYDFVSNTFGSLFVLSQSPPSFLHPKAERVGQTSKVVFSYTGNIRVAEVAPDNSITLGPTLSLTTRTNAKNVFALDSETDGYVIDINSSSGVITCSLLALDGINLTKGDSAIVPISTYVSGSSDTFSAAILDDEFILFTSATRLALRFKKINGQNEYIGSIDYSSMFPFPVSNALSLGSKDAIVQATANPSYCIRLNYEEGEFSIGFFGAYYSTIRNAGNMNEENLTLAGGKLFITARLLEGSSYSNQLYYYGV